jgi:hypothetical protein
MKGPQIFFGKGKVAGSAALHGLMLLVVAMTSATPLESMII